MSALSVVWVARERLMQSKNHDGDDDCTKLILELEGEIKKGEIETKKAYDLDDKVENFLHKKASTTLPSSGDQGKDPDHQSENFLRDTNHKVQDGAKTNLKDKFTSNKLVGGKGQSDSDQVTQDDVVTTQETTTDDQPTGKKFTWKTGKVLSFVHVRGKPKSLGDNTTEKIESTESSQSEEEKVSVASSPAGGYDIISAATDFLSDVSIPEEKCVGRMNEHIAEVEEILLNNNGSKFIWIYANKNGVGKTTLARKLFDKSYKLLHQFDGHAWASVGHKFQARDVADSILLQLSHAAIREKDIQPMATTEMMERLEETQHGRRCLLVLDDVPSVEAWKTIQSILPLHTDTRIVITACLSEQDLKKLEKIPNTALIHRQPLMVEPSWELLENQLTKTEQSMTKDEKWKHSMGILKENIFSRCKGSPLATTVLGGMMRGKLETLLSGKNGELFDWLNKSSSPPGDEPDNSLQELLSLCYKQLPYLLKSCFLYLGLFPHDEVIPVEKVYLMWLAEGLILEREGEARMVTAQDYLKALSQRGLVLLQEEDIPGILKVKSCQLHPMVRNLCILEGKKDGFIRLEKQAEGDQEKAVPKTKRNIAIFVEKLQSSLRHDHAKNIRALLFFRHVGETADYHLKDFELARILDFDRVDFQSRNCPKSIDRLFHLRHLSFRGCNLEQLLCSFSELPFLETLDLFVRNSGSVTIPDNLGNMLSLQHLYLPLSFKTKTGEKLKLNQLTKLETLENFDAGKCDLAGFKQLLENLRIFKGNADGFDKDVEDMVEHIHTTPYLCNSALSLKNFDIDDTDKSQCTVNKLLSTDSLLALEIEGYIGHMPTVNRNIDSVNITKIVFNGSEFDEDPMQILGQFQHLRDLILCNDAYLGTKMNCREGSFPKLQSLELSSLWSLEKLNVETGALPSLASLVIEHCRKFKIWSSDLKQIPTLRKIMIDVEIRD